MSELRDRLLRYLEEDGASWANLTVKKGAPFDWAIGFKWPIGTEHGFVMVGPKNEPDLVQLITEVQFNPKHSLQVGTLPIPERRAFYYELTRSIAQGPVLTAVKLGEDPREFIPASFSIEARFYDDGTTKTGFFDKLAILGAARSSGLAIVQGRLGSAAPGE